MLKGFDMKKIIFCLVALFVASPQAFAEKYYCPQNPSPNYYNSNDIYDKNNDCENWKSEFWQKHHPNAYQECILQQQKLKQSYAQGRCYPVIVKTHNFGNSVGKVEFIPQLNKIVSKSCMGGNGCMEKLNQIYPRNRY